MGRFTEEDIKDLERLMEQETAFLEARGWAHAQKEGCWIDPSGKEFSWHGAIDKAAQDEIYKQGWFPVVVCTSFPQLNEIKKRAGRDPWQDKEFCYYSHPDHSEKLFAFGDLMRCCVEQKSVDDITSIIAERWAKMPTLSNLTYQENMWIHVNFSLVDHVAHYELVEIGDWRERKKGQE